MNRLPRCCLCCGQWQLQALCEPCLARFARPRPRCPRCALPQPSASVCGSCLQQPPPFDSTVVVADYAFPWDRLIATFKFNAQPELARVLVPLLLAALARQTTLPAVDAVLPIPLSRDRLAWRGYNQSWELARHAARALQLPAWHSALWRLRDTPQQAGLNRAERQRNLRDAFWVPPQAAALLRGRRLALVDDVMTTGVTAATASQVLLEAGASGVHVWVLARTPEPAAGATG